MPGKGKNSNSRSSTNSSFDEIKTLRNEKFDDFSKFDVEKFDVTTRDIHIKMNQTEKKAKEVKAHASNNSDKIESLRFETKEQSEKISKQFQTISELESEVEELRIGCQ